MRIGIVALIDRILFLWKVLSVDVLDAAGDVHNDLAHEIQKTRLDPSGAFIEAETAKGTFVENAFILAQLLI